MINSKIKEIIKEKRKKLNLSQEEVAEKMGVSVNYISLLENGRKEPGAVFIEKFSRKFNIPMILLLDNHKILSAKTPKEKEILSKFESLLRDLESLFLKSEN
jgi:transcriptional regulator with XRE-family HTH domain